MERDAVLDRFSQLIWLILGAIEGRIGLRVLLKLVDANPGNVFANWVHPAKDLLLVPYLGLTRTPSANGIVLDVQTLIGMPVWLLLAWG